MLRQLSSQSQNEFTCFTKAVKTFRRPGGVKCVRYLSNTSPEACPSDKNESSKFSIDIRALESSLPPRPPRIMGRALVDIWIEKLTAIANSSPDRTKELMEADLEWTLLATRCRQLDRLINKSNFGAIVMNSCAKHRNFAVAKNYLKWDLNPSVAPLTIFMLLCVENIGLCGGEEGLIRIYQDVKEKNKNAWDMDSGERIIIGLCKTRLWKDSFEIVKSMSIGGTPSPAIFASMAAAAFNNNEFELGWNILVEQAHRSLSDEPFIAWLQNCDPTEESMVKLLEFMEVHEHYGYQDLVDAITNYFSTKLGYGATNTEIYSARDKRVLCKSCGGELVDNDLSEEEFQRLQHHFLTRVLETEDLFMNTTPQELKDYKATIEEALAKRSFDYVVDGLNVAFCRGRDTSAARNLNEVALFLNRTQQKVLIIGRKHMLDWPAKYINHTRRLARFYFINNQSQDDPFMIWAALKSGPKTKFISNDYLRNHSFRLQDPELSRLFKRWRLSRQQRVDIGAYGEVRLEPFAKILPTPQKDELTGNWHIPYHVDSKSPYDIPQKWICLKPVNK